jgi:hypothetical protein
VPNVAQRPDIVLQQLYASDLGRIERHVGPTAKALVKGDDADLPEEGFGSPPTPARG